jgi:hypothetical protein
MPAPESALAFPHNTQTHLARSNVKHTGTEAGAKHSEAEAGRPRAARPRAQSPEEPEQRNQIMLLAQ